MIALPGGWGRPSFFSGLPPRGGTTMAFYTRRLPHWFPEDAAVFVTWRLAGSMPFHAEASGASVADDKKRSSAPLDSFLHQEEGLDCPHCGPVWLQDSRVATVIVDALRYGASVRRFYHLHAWVIMPNHVHVIFQPLAEMSKVMRWLKGRTARLSNRILGRTGTTFWQDESFDHWIRSPEELQDLIAYIENNPVKAGLVDVPRQWRWSSAGLMADDKERSSAPPEM